jgi:hypothetical protein
MTKPQQMPDEITRFFFSPALSLAFCAFVTAILMYWHRSNLLEWLTPFFKPVLDIAALSFFLVSVAVSLGHMIWARKQGIAPAVLPFLLNTVTVVVVFFVPFTSLEFYLHRKARMEAVSTVLDGKCESLIRGGGRGDLLVLPPRFSYLSEGGNVMVWHRQDATLIFFFRFRRVLDSFSGFVYSTNDSPPGQGEFGGRFPEIERLGKNWFWATSTN